MHRLFECHVKTQKVKSVKMSKTRHKRAKEPTKMKG